MADLALWQAYIPPLQKYSNHMQAPCHILLSVYGLCIAINDIGVTVGDVGEVCEKHQFCWVLAVHRTPTTPVIPE